MNTQWRKLFGYFVVISVLAALGLALGGWGDGAWLPSSISSEARDIDRLFWGMTIMSILILAIVMAIVTYSVLHFRARPGDQSDGEPIHGNHRLEVFWTIVPAIIVVVISVLSYAVLEAQESKAAPGKGMKVQVRAFQFGWEFTYPGSDVKAVTNLVLPLNKVVRFDVLSCSGKETTGYCRKWFGAPTQTVVDDSSRRDDDGTDVLHAFWVPEARLKIDAVPNIPTWTQWTPSKISTPDRAYQVVCAELCGDGHNGMRADTCVVSAATFEWWTEHSDVSCGQLRYFSCVDDPDHDELLGTIDDVVAKDPEADCDDLEEAA